MSKTILVTFASRTGSTAEVAQVIGKTLAEGGATVEVRPMQEVHDLTPYSAVVAGSAVRGQKWLPEAMQFMQVQRQALNQRPVAIFEVCMTLAMGNGKYREQVAEWMAPVRALVRPVSEGLFAGILDLKQAMSIKDRLMFRVSIAMGVWTEGDHRDWNAIHAWAESLRPLLC